MNHASEPADLPPFRVLVGGSGPGRSSCVVAAEAVIAAVRTRLPRHERHTFLPRFPGLVVLCGVRGATLTGEAVSVGVIHGGQRWQNESHFLCRKARDQATRRSTVCGSTDPHSARKAWGSGRHIPEGGEAEILRRAAGAEKLD